MPFENSYSVHLHLGLFLTYDKPKDVIKILTLVEKLSLCHEYPLAMKNQLFNTVSKFVTDLMLVGW